MLKNGRGNTIENRQYSVLDHRDKFTYENSPPVWRFSYENSKSTVFRAENQHRSIVLAPNMALAYRIAEGDGSLEFSCNSQSFSFEFDYSAIKTAAPPDDTQTNQVKTSTTRDLTTKTITFDDVTTDKPIKTPGIFISKTTLIAISGAVLLLVLILLGIILFFCRRKTAT